MLNLGFELNSRVCKHSARSRNSTGESYTGLLSAVLCKWKVTHVNSIQAKINLSESAMVQNGQWKVLQSSMAAWSLIKHASPRKGVKVHFRLVIQVISQTLRSVSKSSMWSPTVLSQTPPFSWKCPVRCSTSRFYQWVFPTWLWIKFLCIFGTINIIPDPGGQQSANTAKGAGTAISS